MTSPSSSLVVSTEGGADFTDLERAIQAVAEGGQIQVQAGCYTLPLELSKAVRITGLGADQTTLRPPGGAGMTIGAAAVSLASLRVERSPEDDVQDSLVTLVGGQLELQGCVFAAASGVGLMLQGGQSSLADCRFEGLPSGAVYLLSGTRGDFSACTFQGGGQGLCVLGGAARLQAPVFQCDGISLLVKEGGLSEVNLGRFGVGTGAADGTRIKICADSRVELNDCTITDGEGFGCWVNGGRLVARRTSVTGEFGGIYCDQHGRVQLHACVLSCGEMWDIQVLEGGRVQLHDCSLQGTGGVTVKGASLDLSGGDAQGLDSAVLGHPGSRIRVKGTVFSDNGRDLDCAPGVWLVVQDCTLSEGTLDRLRDQVGVAAVRMDSPADRVDALLARPSLESFAKLWALADGTGAEAEALVERLDAGLATWPDALRQPPRPRKLEGEPDLACWYSADILRHAKPRWRLVRAFQPDTSFKNGGEVQDVGSVLTGAPIRHLTLSYRKLGGTGLRHLVSDTPMPRLRSLTLTGTRMQGKTAQAFFSSQGLLGGLEALRVENSVRGAAAWTALSTSPVLGGLKSLDLSGGMSKAVADAMFTTQTTLRSLTHLGLEATNLGGQAALLADWAPVTGLSSLSLERAGVDGQHLLALMQATGGLTRFSMRYGGAHNALLDLLLNDGRFSGLTHLALPSSGVDAESMEMIGSATLGSLRELSLGGNLLGATGFWHLDQAPCLAGLERLDLGDAGLMAHSGWGAPYWDAGPTNVGDILSACPRLRDVGLSGILVMPGVAEAIAGTLPPVERLSLAASGLSSPIEGWSPAGSVATIIRSGRLLCARELDFSRLPLDAADLTALRDAELPHLQELIIRGIEISGQAELLAELKQAHPDTVIWHDRIG